MTDSDIVDAVTEILNSKLTAFAKTVAIKAVLDYRIGQHSIGETIDKGSSSLGLG